jgi:ABC-type Fe3+-siderophore transport system permease subunit
MHLIHFRDLHVPHGPNLYFISAGAFACFVLALTTYVIAWLGGGDNYASQLGGNTSLVLILAGLALSAICALVTKPEE